MIKEEKGSTLLIVMLMVLVFTILGMTILSVSISGAKKTEVRKESITENLDAIRELNEAVAFIRATIHNQYTPGISLAEYDRMIKDLILNNPYGYKIENVRTDLTEFTRVLSVTTDAINDQSYQQTVYITPMPSFLKYAIGSRDVLTINGSLYLQEGNMYARNKLEIANQAKYIYDASDKVVSTTFPSVADESKNFLMLENEFITYCDSSKSNCYNGSIKNTFNPLSIKNLSNAFEPNAPTYMKDTSEFIEVDIIKTFIEKLKNSGTIAESLNTSTMSNDQLKLLAVNSISDVAKKGGNEKVQVINSFNDIDKVTTKQSFLYNGDAYIEANRLNVDKSGWLIINGDAYFENSGSEKMDVSANILVTGNVSMKGELAFNSTIYALGKTKINNVDISGLENGELILMSEDALEIAKLNKFDNPDSTKLDEVDSIKAFLYTNSDAVVYAIGSYIYIDGGLFAHGDLEINAFRGKTYDETTSLKFVKELDEQASRLIIKNNKKLFLNHAEGLPKVDQLEVVTDLMKKE